MNRTLSIILCIQISLGVLFGIFVAYVAYTNSIEGRPDLTPGRIILSLLLVIYSGIHILPLVKKQISKIKLVAFPIIYILFGLYFESSSRGFIKNWAPASELEAIQQNIICLVFLIIIMATAYVIALRKTNI